MLDARPKLRKGFFRDDQSDLSKAHRESVNPRFQVEMAPSFIANEIRSNRRKQQGIGLHQKTVGVACVGESVISTSGLSLGVGQLDISSNNFERPVNLLESTPVATPYRASKATTTSAIVALPALAPRH